MGLSKKFFVNNGGQNLGPFDLETIIKKVSESELKATDFIYLEDRDDWVLICQLQEFLVHFSQNKPLVKPRSITVAETPIGATVSVAEKTVSKSIAVNDTV